LHPVDNTGAARIRPFSGPVIIVILLHPFRVNFRVMLMLKGSMAFDYRYRALSGFTQRRLTDNPYYIVVHF